MGFSGQEYWSGLPYPPPRDLSSSGIEPGSPALHEGFPCDSASKESAYNAGDLGLIPGLGRSPGEGKDYPLQYSGLENPHGQRSPAGYNPWGHKESDMIERLRTIAMGMMRPQNNRGHIVEINSLKSEDCSHGS